MGINQSGMMFFNVFPNIFQVPVRQRIDLQPPEIEKNSMSWVNQRR